MIEINNKTRTKINQKIIRMAVEKFFKKYRINCQTEKKEISIAFIGSAKMRELNRVYRKKDKTTDVLSFLGEDDFLGEILINPGKIKKQAKENKKTFQSELIFILVHGLLHLLGHNDETEKDRLKMIKTGEEFIKNLKV